MEEPPRPSLDFLMSLNYPLEINRADEAVGLIRVDIGPIRYGGSRTQVIGRPASQDNDLKDARFLGEQSPKPVHAVTVTLHQLIIETLPWFVGPIPESSDAH